MLAAGDDGVALENLQVALALGTGPLAVEPGLDGVEQRVALVVDTDLERVAALDADRGEAAVLAGVVDDRRAAGQRVAVVALETGDRPAGADQRAATRAGADRDAGVGSVVVDDADVALSLNLE